MHRNPRRDSPANPQGQRARVKRREPFSHWDSSKSTMVGMLDKAQEPCIFAVHVMRVAPALMSCGGSVDEAEGCRIVPAAMLCRRRMARRRPWVHVGVDETGRWVV